MQCCIQQRNLGNTALNQNPSSSPLPRILPHSAPRSGMSMLYASSGLSLEVTRTEMEPCFLVFS